MSDIIQTQRLTLRSVNSKDENFFIQLWMDPQVRKHLGGPITLEQAQKKFLENVGKMGYFTITVTEGGRPIGLCYLDKHHTNEIEVSYELSPDDWAKGYGKEAVQSVVEWGFEHLNIDHMIAVTQTANTSSRKLLETIGMRSVDEFREFGEPQTKYSLPKQ